MNKTSKETYNAEIELFTEEEKKEIDRDAIISSLGFVIAFPIHIYLKLYYLMFF